MMRMDLYRHPSSSASEVPRSVTGTSTTLHRPEDSNEGPLESGRSQRQEESFVRSRLLCAAASGVMCKASDLARISTIGALLSSAIQF